MVTSLRLAVDNARPDWTWRFDIGMSLQASELPFAISDGQPYEWLEIDDVEDRANGMCADFGTLLRRHRLGIRGRHLRPGQGSPLDQQQLDSFAEFVGEYAPTTVCQVLPRCGLAIEPRAFAASLDRARRRLEQPLLIDLAIATAAGCLAPIAAAINDNGCFLRFGLADLFDTAAGNVDATRRLIDKSLDCLPSDITVVLELPGTRLIHPDESWYGTDNSKAAEQNLLWHLYVQIIERLGPTPTVFTWASLPAEKTARALISTAKTIMACVGANREHRSAFGGQNVRLREAKDERSGQLWETSP